jgi:transcriptional pleiotropic regulator of transition state genes
MKSTGIIRKIDELGRLVIPKELRESLDIKEKDSMEIFVEGDSIILRKYNPSCYFCGNADNPIYFKGKLICRDCLSELNRTF